MPQVTLRLFLAGAHEHSWSCPPDHPSVGIVMDAMSANAHPKHHGGSPLVRLVVPDGHGGDRALVFLRQSLIAVETTPALVDELPTVHSARRAWMARQGKANGQVQRPRYVGLPDFLPQQVRDELFAWMVAHQQDFLPSGVRSRPGSAADDYDFRQSRVSMQLGPWRAVFEARLAEVLPAICEELEEAVPERPRLELQLTHHGHLDHFKVHTDNSNGELRQRRISLVYYLHRHPRPFSGGELVLFDQVTAEDGSVHKGEGFRVLQPDDNTLIAFPSAFHHQVRSVRLAEGDFGDGRLTVNGWLRDLDQG